MLAEAYRVREVKCDEFPSLVRSISNVSCVWKLVQSPPQSRARQATPPQSRWQGSTCQAPGGRTSRSAGSLASVSPFWRSLADRSRPSGITADETHLVSALHKPSGDCSTDPLRGAKPDSRHVGCPKCRTDCALRSRNSGSRRRRTASHRSRRGSMARKCSAHVSVSLAK